MKRPTRRTISILGATLLVAGLVRGADPKLSKAWQALSTGLYADAGSEFARAAHTREARLGEAINLVNQPPVTPSSLDDARDRLTALSAGDDETAHAARYFLGRLQQLHPNSPDPVAAAHEYEALVATNADDTWCRLALIKLAILRLTVLAPPGDSAIRFTDTERLLTRTRDVLTLRDLHLVIAEARLNHRVYDEATLDHLRAALAITPANDALRVDLLVQIGRLASKLGDRETARTHYAQFLKDYPKERRCYTVQSALDHLEGSFPP
ncbi:MAG: hypothetical protein JWM35_39 [Verrucomicrobia bacterium]|nr:hypothetical protein [Verrucomicrobiota bacterium]